VDELKVGQRQRRIFAPETSAFRQVSSTEDKRDVISADSPVVPQMLGRWRLAIMLVTLMAYAAHFLVLESKMSFLLNSDLAE
jgi:hypothetical protein